MADWRCGFCLVAGGGVRGFQGLVYLRKALYRGAVGDSGACQLRGACEAGGGWFVVLTVWRM